MLLNFCSGRMHKDLGFGFGTYGLGLGLGLVLGLEVSDLGLKG